MSILSDQRTQEIQRGFVRYGGDKTDIDEGRAIAEAAYRETLKMVGEWLAGFHGEHSTNNVRYQRRDCDICIGRLKLGTFKEADSE